MVFKSEDHAPQRQEPHRFESNIFGDTIVKIEDHAHAFPLPLLRIRVREFAD